jgi:DNA polymerase-4
MALVRQAARVTEQVSIDEAYLDFTEEVQDWTAGVDRATALQNSIRREAGLSVSVGVATNRLVAKVASDRDKPGGLTVVPPGEEAAFLAPLPVRVLWGVGPVMAARLEAIGISTVGDLQKWSRESLWDHVGKRAGWLIRQARGEDRRTVSSERRRKSVGRERTFPHNLLRINELLDQVRSLSASLARRLARANVAAGTIALKIRYSDFTTLTRQMRLAVPASDEEAIFLAASALLRRGWQEGRPVRLLGVSARDLCAPLSQLRLPGTDPGGAKGGPLPG